MKLLTAEQIRAWDRYTIDHEPISSIDLMERAALKCTQWLAGRQWKGRKFIFFCGKGNNGGDGLAIARQLVAKGYSVTLYIVELGKEGSPDFQTNLQRLHELDLPLHYLQPRSAFPEIGQDDIVIDALFGSGLNKPLEGIYASLVHHINSQKGTIVAIDVPSGMFMDSSSKDLPVIKATFTLTFQCYKKALLIQENASFSGMVVVLNIGLLPHYLSTIDTTAEYVEFALIRSIYRPRQPFANKGNYGHALLMAGGYGKMGAAAMACKACLRAGAGLTTAYIPAVGYTVMQTMLPEVMVMTDPEEHLLSTLPEGLDKFTVVGVGPGIGTEEPTQHMLDDLLSRYRKPMVIDADGLNCLSRKKERLQHLPPSSILTPHPKEFDRLFGDQPNDFERDKIAREQAKALGVIIILKGHHTLVATPAGHAYYNSTGNAGMAKGGSGDILTGILTALLAQGYDPVLAAIMGVYLHGYAGDLAARANSEEAMIPEDIIESIGQFFLDIKGTIQPTTSSFY